MYLILKLWVFRKFFGKTAYDVITSPISKMRRGLEYLVSAKATEMEILEAMHSAASDEQDAAAATLNSLSMVVA